MRTTVATAALALMASAWTLAQQTPTFRLNTDLVVVDFTATTSNGQPIVDLKIEDLRLEVRGRQREVRTLEFVRLADPEPAPAGVNATAPMPFGSNLPADAGRTVMIVIDDETMQQGAERRARESAQRFLDLLPPRDRVGLMTIPYTAVAIDPTTSRPPIREALARMTGHLNLHDSNQVEQPLCRIARFSMSALEALFRNLASIDGPKVVALVTGGFWPSDRCGLDPLALQDLGRAAARGRIALSIVQVSPGPASAQLRSMRPLAMYELEKALLGGAEDVAGATGGEVFRASGGADAAFAKITRASSAYYLLGFAAEPDERNGKAHKITLATSRRRVEIRARPEFVIPDLRAETLPSVAGITSEHTLGRHPRRRRGLGGPAGRLRATGRR
jgi:VWFA-related protein